MQKEEKLQTGIAKALDADKVEVVKDLRRQLGEHLAEGAEKCKNCGHDVVGMVKTPAYIDRDGTEVPTKYEVGCVICPPFWVENENGDEVELDGKKVKIKRRSYSARAFSIAEAVRKWNAGEWIEDKELTRNIPPLELARLKR